MTDAADSASEFRALASRHGMPADRLAFLASLTHYSANCAVPLLDRHEGNHVVRGTGTLFRTADKSFLITAAHVVREGPEWIWSRLVMPNRQRTAALSLIAPEVVLTSEQCKYDPDIAVLRLDEEIATRLVEANLTFLSPDQVVARDTPVVDSVFVCGYPGDYFPSGRSLKHLRPLVILTKRSDRTPPQLPFTLRPGVQTLLERGEAGFNLGPQSEVWPVPLPALGGISGCPVFVAGAAEEDRQRVRDGGVFRPDIGLKLVGVEIGVFPDSNLIRMTTWSAVASLMAYRWPELNGEFERAKVWLKAGS